MQEDPQKQTYDIAIVGTGAAGYTASIYASRYKMSNIVIGSIMGGQTSEAHIIKNFPSYKEISGMDLMTKFKEHVESYDIPIEFDTVTHIEGAMGDFILKTESGKQHKANAILLATGTIHRTLGLPNEDNLFGKGVTYCATCDAMLFKDKVVAVVGGSDAANTASLHLVEIASKVYQIYRQDKLRGEPAWSDQVASHPKIEVLYNTNVTGIFGKDKLEAIKLDQPHNGSDMLKLDGLFIEIGSKPDRTLTDLLGITINENGYIVVESNQKTNVPGVWAAGDNTTGSNSFRQTITAAAEGAVATEDIFSSTR